MRIIVDTALNTGAGEYQNMGDVSMLQVAVNRLLKLWPSPCVQVLTGSPENLAKYCPGAKPLTRAGRNLWVGDSFLLGRVHNYLPDSIARRLSGLTTALERISPSFLGSMVRKRLWLRDAENIGGDLIAFLEAMENADLFIVCGAGGFADSCREWNMSTLNTLEVALRRKIRVVMFGQAMGPLSDAEVLSKARGVFPAVGLVTLRGGRGGQPLLESLGVRSDKILTTGDEAVELAFEARSQEIGCGLGVNLRIASYAGTGEEIVVKLKSMLHEFAAKHGVPLVPLPIAFHSRANDPEAIRRVLAGHDDQSDGGANLDTPMKVIQQATRCRVVVTCAYHAAVFALAQGIPVVCLTNSAYYDAKFLGLEDQFGLGCETVSLANPELLRRLPEALERAWQSAEAVRLPLRQAALRQIEAGRSAYGLVRDMTDTHRAEKSPGRRDGARE
jgi:polysaccharide pyruvyl transferase WcaK-like protein